MTDVKEWINVTEQLHVGNYHSLETAGYAEDLFIMTFPERIINYVVK